jgi:hypothetical protein
VGAVLSRSDVERLADAIIADWLDSRTDSGSIWKTSHEASRVLQSELGEEGLQQAYDIAYARWEAMRKSVR